MSKVSHEIRLATIEDRENILFFLKVNWSESLIYVKDPEFFDYEFLEDRALNFVVAYRSGVLEGILGFIKTSRRLSQSCIQTVLWKVIPRCENPILGISLLDFLLNGDFKRVSSVGIGKHTERLYKFLKLKTGKLDHFYILNPVMNEFNIASGELVRGVAGALGAGARSLLPIKNFGSIDLSNSDKDLWYLHKRYCLHPYYEYQLMKIEETDTVLVFREQIVRDSKVLRLIDYIGDPSKIGELGNSLENLLIKGCYEYIDFYCSGFKTKVLGKAGFQLNKMGSSVVIPNYFSPFEKSNIEIYYFTNSTCLGSFFKGDGDQDRPN